MRNALIGSAAVHGAVLAVLFVVRAGTPIIVPGPDVVQVALVDPSALAPTPPAPKAVEPEPKREVPELAPEPGEGVKLVKPAPPKKKPPEKAPEKAPETPPLQEPALPYAAVGTGGLRGAVAVDAANFEFTYYLLLVRNRIAQSWSPPAGLATGGHPVRAVVYFRIGRDGSLSGVRLETTSSVEFFDRSALRAVALSDPMPPLPLGFSSGSLGVHFGFEYATP